MALIVPSGGLVSQVNGTVDNKVYYRGRWGNCVRTWVNPTNTITPERTAIRALFASLVSLFNSLTPDMQDDWNQFAGYITMFNRLAQPYVPTGLQVFMERNINLAIVGAGPLLLPPDDTSLPSITSFSAITFNAVQLLTDGTIYNNLSVVPANCNLAYYATNNVNAGINFQSNRYRLLTYSSPGGSLLIDVHVNWAAAWLPSLLIPGKKVFIKCVLINTNTGQASQPAFCSKIIS